MGISLLELVKNQFPITFPPDAPAFEVILTISKGQVGELFVCGRPASAEVFSLLAASIRRRT